MIAWLDHADTLLLGPFWFAGCVLLGGGALVAWVARIPSWRVRISELAFFGMALWLILALVPMPRLGQVESPGSAITAVPVVDLENVLSPVELAMAMAQANAAPLPVLPEPVAAEAPAATVLPSITDVWLLAAALSFAALLVGALLLWRLLSRSVPADASVQRIAQQVATRLGLKKAVVVRLHDKVRAPFCCKLRTVVLPKELLADRNALRAVLAHELAHIVAHDPLRRSLFALLTPLFILHPAWWVLRRMSTQASEEAADARAAMALGRVASQYARPLIELSARLGQNGVAPLHPSIVGVLGQPTSFTRRMTMLLTRDPAQAVRSLNRRQGVLATASTLLALALSVGAWGTPAAAQDPAQGTAVAPMDQTIRPDFTDCALRDALLAISRKSSLRIAIDTDVAARKIRIERLSLGEMPVRRLLDTLAVAHNLRWKIEKGRVVFRTAKAKTLPVDVPAEPGHDINRILDGARDVLGQPKLIKEYRPAIRSSVNRHTAPPEVLQAIMESYQASAANLRAAAVASANAKQAREHYSRGEMQRAVQVCERALELNPEDAEALLVRGSALRALGDEAGARQSFELARKLQPEEPRRPAASAEYTAEQIKALTIPYATVVREKFERGEIQAALDLCEIALKFNPEDVGVLEVRAKALRAMGDEASARSKALTVNYSKLAQQRFKRADMQTAIEFCERALQLNPNDAVALKVRGKALQAMGDEAAAKQSFDRANRLQPGKAYDRAKSDYYKLDPEKQKGLMRGRYIDSTGRIYDEALNKSVEKVLPDALRKASERSRQGKASEAMRKALKKAHPDLPEQYYELLYQYYRRGDLDIPGYGKVPKEAKRSKAKPTASYPLPGNYGSYPEMVVPGGVVGGVKTLYKDHKPSGYYDTRGRFYQLRDNDGSSNKSTPNKSKANKSTEDSMQPYFRFVEESPVPKVPGEAKAKKLSRKLPGDVTVGEPGWVKGVKDIGR